MIYIGTYIHTHFTLPLHLATSPGTQSEQWCRQYSVRIVVCTLQDILDTCPVPDNTTTTLSTHHHTLQPGYPTEIWKRTWKRNMSRVELQKTTAVRYRPNEEQFFQVYIHTDRKVGLGSHLCMY